jgi:hypothetical protein
MFDLLPIELQEVMILNNYLINIDACLIKLLNKSIFMNLNYIFEEKIKKIKANRGKIICSKISSIFKNVYFIYRMQVNIIWEVPLKSICVYKKKSKLILKVGDIISYQGRETGVKITNFTGFENKLGPIGFEYLPWIGDRWATPIITLRGNPRHVITYPTGLPHYGEQINWYSVFLLNNNFEIDL